MQIITLAIAALGGSIFTLVNIPLGWLLGSMVFVLVFSFFTGADKLHIPNNWRQCGVCIIGILAGSIVKPDFFSVMLRYAPTVGVMIVSQLFLMYLGTWYFHKRLKNDPVTSFFASFPGGVSQISAISLDHKCDLQLIALNHATRLFFVIAIIPIIVVYIARGEIIVDPDLISTAASSEVPILNYILPIIIGFVGFLAAKKCKLITPALYGPMLLMAALSLGGVIPENFQTGNGLVMLAQLVIGASVGLRLRQSSSFDLKDLLSVHLLFALLLLAFTLTTAFIIHKVFGIPLEVSLLLITPGGLSEMILISYMLDIDPVMVTTHHIVRSLFLLMMIPLVVHVLTSAQPKLSHMVLRGFPYLSKK